eukprot:12242731-Alexandrium_andersonii.AAC.1
MGEHTLARALDLHQGTTTKATQRFKRLQRFASAQSALYTASCAPSPGGATAPRPQAHPVPAPE